MHTSLRLRAWQQRRHDRIDRLAAFLDHAARHARHHDPTGWYGQHVVWALARLERLGYSFPEVDVSPLPRRWPPPRASRPGDERRSLLAA